MTTLSELKSAARQQGATIRMDGDRVWTKCEAHAPRGHVWTCNGMPVIRETAQIPWAPDYGEVLRKMERGLTDPSGSSRVALSQRR